MSFIRKIIKNDFLRKLLHNNGAVFGLLVIKLAIFVALFCYFMAPDASPNANRIIVEIAGAKPGTKTQFVLVKKENPLGQNGFFTRLIYGQNDPYSYVPITGFTTTADSVTVQKIIGEGITEPQTFSKNQLAPEFSITKKYWLGTDSYGRDVLSRILIGTRVSLSVGLITVIISLTIGILLGALAGYFKGKTDAVIMWWINVIWSIPTLLLVFAITLALGKGFWQIFIAVGLTMWVNVARLVRGQVMALRSLNYIEAAKALGYSHFRIIFKHILPNIWGPILVIATANFASAIIVAAGLSFLGIGVQPPQPSWGLMIKENYNFIITNNPVLAIAPGIAIMLLVFAFNLLGNGLRDALDVK